MVAVLLLVFAVNIYAAFQRPKKPQALPWIFGYSHLIVNSGSMETALSVDDLIIIQQNAPYGKNDIITFWQDHLFVTHRIVDESETGLVTKGDANPIADEPIERSQVVGKVVGIVPGMGSVIRMLQSPYGTALLLLVGVVLAYLGIRNRTEQEDANDRNERR